MIDFFYSDPHFGHENIIEFCDRPFADVEHQTESFVERYNMVVSPGQLTLWVGDAFFVTATEARVILSRLNGDKVLVRGNHDGSIGHCLNVGFTWVVDEMFLKLAGRRVRVRHYPPLFTPWKQKYPDPYADRRPKLVKGELLIHGHTHSKIRMRDNYIHVGVDAWDYAPVSCKDIEELIDPDWSPTKPLFGE